MVNTANFHEILVYIFSEDRAFASICSALV